MRNLYLVKYLAEKINVSIFLTNGIKLQGIICDFDENIIYLQNNDCFNLVYIHAIATICSTTNLATKVTQFHPIVA